MRRRPAGMSLVEVMIGLAIMAILLGLGVPSMSTWLMNAQVRTMSETLLQGLNLARAEAVRRNGLVRFQLVSGLTSSCAVSTSGVDWVVSLADPASKCDIAPSETVAPQTLQKKAGSEGSPKAAVTATTAGVITFNALGRPSSVTANMTQIDITNPTFSACQHASPAGQTRCMRILITTGGTVKLCDPNVSVATDPRICS
jgi:type IV fimbrial biogenesis protein FimT